MRFRRVMLALMSLLLAGSIASAQTPPKKKKKKPKKPNVTQPAQTDDDDDDKPGPPPTQFDPPKGGYPPPTQFDPPKGGYPPPTQFDPPKGGYPPPTQFDPPKTQTGLKETDSSSSNSNPWSSSGLVKKKGDGDSSSSDAPSKDPYPPRGKIAAEGFGGYGSANLRIGFGVRAGYTMRNHVYLGGAFTYHLGTRFGTRTVTFWYPGFEGGYEYRATELITLRPYAGLAFGVVHSSDSSNILLPATTNASFVFYPGFQADFQLPHAPVYLGADLRLVVAAGSNAPDASFGFFLFAGARFF